MIDGVDFKSKITRKELEDVSGDLLARVSNPVNSVIQNAGLSLANISSLVLVGGGVRVPSVQNTLIDLLGS